MSIRPPHRSATVAFTLIELLTVISIIAILVGLLLPAIQIAKDMIHKGQARHSSVAIAAAVKAYSTDYGKYPLGDKTPDPSAPADVLFGDSTTSNQALFDILRAIGPAPGTPNQYNPKNTVFFEGNDVSNPTSPKSGFATQNVGTVKTGAYVDPWGNEYRIAIDADGDNQITNLPYSDFQGAQGPRVGVAVFSLGKDGLLGHNGDGAYRNGATTSDDVLSWQ